MRYKTLLTLTVLSLALCGCQTEEQKQVEIRRLSSEVQFMAKCINAKKSITTSEKIRLQQKLARLAELGVTVDVEMTPKYQ